MWNYIICNNLGYNESSNTYQFDVDGSQDDRANRVECFLIPYQLHQLQGIQGFANPTFSFV